MKTAIVLGAGIGGLLAAGVLARHFGHVLILERDQLPATPRPRLGVPQGPQVHAVMKRGENAIEAILPGFRQRLEAAGGTTVRVGLEMIVHEGGGWHPANDIGFTLSTQTRALLEQVIRAGLLERANVTLRQGCRFRNLVFDQDGRVAGAAFEAAFGAGGLQQASADLVIDAMGRASPVPERLAERGLGQAPVSVTGIDLSYSTLLLHPPEQWRGQAWVRVLRATAPEHTRGATLFPIEGDRCLLSLVSRFGDRPPTALEECIAFTESLEAPEIFERVRHAKQAVAAKRFHIPETRVTRFDQMRGYPLGLLPLGDVIGTFNPLLAQGMTIAALHAEALGEKLALHMEDDGDGALDWAGLARDYIPAATALSVAAWRAGAYADFAYPQTTGERPADLAEHQRFGKALRQGIAEDPELHRLAVRVQQMLDPPNVLPRAEILGAEILARAEARSDR